MTIDDTRDHGDLRFEPGVNPRTYKRREPIRHIVLHWTAGIRGAAGVHQTLIKRGYSIHDVAEPDGDIVNMADPSTRCSHATHLSDTSLGLEAVGLGYSKRYGNRFKHRNWPEQMFEKYSCTIDGKTKKCIAFTPPQTEAIVEYCIEMCERFDIPKIYPGPDRVPSRKVKLFARNFSGVLGHYHVHTRTSRWSKGKGTKWDPGTQIFDALDDAGFCQVQVSEFI